MKIEILMVFIVALITMVVVISALAAVRYEPAQFRFECVKQACHQETELVPYPDGMGGTYVVPMSKTVCECVEYGDAGE